MFILLVPGPAYAAQGNLVINGVKHANPHGCFKAGQSPLAVTDNTDRPAVVYRNRNCTGLVDSIVLPGWHGVFREGVSVHVD